MQLETKERPIIMSSPMICALLENRKSQTRRLCKISDTGATWNYPLDNSAKKIARDFCRFGKVGDRLWVREKIYCFDGNTLPKSKGEHFDSCAGHPPSTPWHFGCDYATNIEDSELDTVTKTISPIFMPRWCARIELVLTEVSIERVGDISWSDAIAEGLGKRPDLGNTKLYSYGNCLGEYFDPIAAFGALWNSINTTPGTKFSDNPWVWVLKFDVRLNAKNDI